MRQLDEIGNGFSEMMQAELEKMWASKLGLTTFQPALFSELVTLMVQTPVDYTLFFRELSSIPDNINSLKKSFYTDPKHSQSLTQPTVDIDAEEMDRLWSSWLIKWRSLIENANATDVNQVPPRSLEEVSRQMKLVNPKYSLREWLLVPAYSEASDGNYSLIRELQEVFSQPYAEQSKEVEKKYYRIKPSEFFDVGGLSYLSCSS